MPAMIEHARREVELDRLKKLQRDALDVLHNLENHNPGWVVPLGGEGKAALIAALRFYTGRKDS
jgi:hypothetical protein